MMFDTDILIFVEKGNEKAASLIENDNERIISVQTYMELLQNAKNKKHHKYTKDFINDYDFKVLPLTQNIGHRALIYVEEYTLSSNLGAADAIIATTAVENNVILATSNKKHFNPIKELKLKVFNP